MHLKRLSTKRRRFCLGLNVWSDDIYQRLWIELTYTEHQDITSDNANYCLFYRQRFFTFLHPEMYFEMLFATCLQVSIYMYAANYENSLQLSFNYLKLKPIKLKKIALVKSGDYLLLKMLYFYGLLSNYLFCRLCNILTTNILQLD